MTTEATVVFVTVVGLRFLLPLFIPRWPLPAVLACLVLDGIDQSIFQRFGFDPPGYQNYDKAMDLFYLSIAFLSSLQNWTKGSAVSISRFLFFYRMVGVVLFELSGWRPILLIFPNTFEYFFIAYEAVRTRWNPTRIGMRRWVLTAAAIWVFVKLPQEWWIHVAQLDFTDTVRDIPWFGPAVVAAVLLLLGILWFVVRPRLPAPDWTWQIAAGPLPEAMDTAAERDAWFAQHGRVWSGDTLEKVFLVGLLSVVYAQVLPDLSSTTVELFTGLGAIVVVSTAIGLWVARGAGSRESFTLGFLLRVALNLGILLLAVWLPLVPSPGHADMNWTAAFFFVVLLSLLTTLHDRYRPVHDYRSEHPDPSDAPATPA
jgi:uncharacterized membrane protein